MPLSQPQVADAVHAAVNTLKIVPGKPHSERASVNMSELLTSAGRVHAALVAAESQSRQAVTDATHRAKDSLKSARSLAAEFSEEAETATDATAIAKATFAAAKAAGYVAVADAQVKAATAHAKAAAPAVDLEDVAAIAQANAEAARSVADGIRDEGHRMIADAADAAKAAIAIAQDQFDEKLAEIAAAAAVFDARLHDIGDPAPTTLGG